MKKHDRLKVILDELQKHKKVHVKELSDTFAVSFETIRRDLAELEKQGYLKRVHGGAVAVKRNIQVQNFIERRTTHVKEKQMLAKNCIPLIEEGDFLAFDASTSNVMIVQELINHFKQLTVLTNDLYNAQQMALNTKWKILFPSGEIKNGELFVGGVSAVRYIQQFQIDKFFMSISGFTPELGFMDYGYEEYEVKMAMYNNANQIFVVADHHKFGKQAMLKVCEANEVDGVITDEGIDKETVQFFKANKIPIYY